MPDSQEFAVDCGANHTGLHSQQGQYEGWGWQGGSGAGGAAQCMACSGDLVVLVVAHALHRTRRTGHKAERGCACRPCRATALSSDAHLPRLGPVRWLEAEHVDLEDGPVHQLTHALFC